MFLPSLFSLSPLLLLLLLLALLPSTPAQDHLSFTFNNFKAASPNLTLDGIAEFTPSGLLALTNGTRNKIGHAFFPTPFPFKPSPNASVSSFSTSFIFSIITDNPTYPGHGIVFVVAPAPRLPGALSARYLGLFNETNNGNSTNHVVAVELDTVRSSNYKDINDNHVGIDINGLDSVASKAAGYYSSNGRFQNLSLTSGKAMQVWVEYDGGKKEMNVTMAPVDLPKPNTPLLTLSKDLSPILNQTMYVGFSSSSSPIRSASHYLLAWSFNMNGLADGFDFSQLPKLPQIGQKKTYMLFKIGLPLICLVLVFGVVSGVVFYIRRKRKFAEVLEDWELDYGPHRFKYKDLYIATKGFGEKGLLGSGGFGRVYRGILPTSEIEIAVKRVSHESRQGMREFVAEIVSVGRMRHRNLVQLLGYCRRKGELLLVYDYMPNGSLDRFLYNQPSFTLSWQERFRVIKGVASGLFYLHEEWEQVVVHRDVKPSNVLLDGELNGRLGDFGLARLCDHGTDPQTTNVAGTLGYLAPEHNRTGKATTSTDVYAFGAFLLEVACGRRPIEPRAAAENLVLVDWVFSYWRRGEILQTVDSKLGSQYVAEEVELVLKLGLWCSHSEPVARPSMRQVVQYLEGDIPLPELKLMCNSATGLMFAHREGFDDFVLSHPQSSSVAESLLSGGR
ncbi:L-type lectin-domain containing receptor kinase IV.1-like [Rhododendron vialii]|uniref:L-type lectin-domain containing receptor kinase IV.1-like n=1 Tax=Rhododendron vialii TaxID=182163 RepID=UPI00265F6595|nr:L-type lectin-domain containing receptor kinase IV.1-like [Rhododendron vialii]